MIIKTSCRDKSTIKIIIFKNNRIEIFSYKRELFQGKRAIICRDISLDNFPIITKYFLGLSEIEKSLDTLGESIENANRSFDDTIGFLKYGPKEFREHYQVCGGIAIDMGDYYECSKCAARFNKEVPK